MSAMIKKKNPENHLREKNNNRRAFEAALCDVIRVRENDARKTTRHEKSMATRRCCCYLLKNIFSLCASSKHFYEIKSKFSVEENII